MDSKTKSMFTNIYKIDKFQTTLLKLTIDDVLDDDEKTYILTCALMFLNYYTTDITKITYLEFAYYIILKYSVSYNEYKPLYDFSVNFWFYPISKFILDNNLLEEKQLDDILIDLELWKFNNWEYFETFEQNKVKKDFLSDSWQELSYIAPTSYGKSSLIIDFLKNDHNHNWKKIWIIVPSKSLLIQTYKLIKEINIDNKILIHDEMFSNEESFVAIFTQERALRLLKKNPNVYFDVLFIDEAHNIFNKDPRSTLLSRLIWKNIKWRPDCKIIYLSPLITDSNNLKVNDNQTINVHKIEFNIKEPEIFEYNDNNEIYKHNRFVVSDTSKGYKIWDWIGSFEYIIESALSKNFIFHKIPRKIERVAKELSESIYNANWGIMQLPDEINEIIFILENEVHKDFYWIDFLKNWVIYIHGKMPDLIKEYLELKFKKISYLKYIVANSVILEWINLPINSLFILYTHWLSWKNLTNLIWRVNRLNDVFSPLEEKLTKLLPRVHFVSSNYEHSSCKQFNKIKLLRDKTFNDNVKNPTLKEFDIEKITNPNEKKKMELIQKNEKLLYIETSDERLLLKQYLIETWINKFYKDEFIDKVEGLILSKISQPKDEIWLNLRILDKINKIFTDGFSEKQNWEYESYINDYEIRRLSNRAARDYYEYFIDINLKQSLSENIDSTYKYFKKKSESRIETDRKFYFAQAYWEVIYDSINYPHSLQRVYVDVQWKSDKELINLAIIKIKLEENFISFKLNKLIVFLYDYKIISEGEYNKYVYWTNDEQVIKYINRWLNSSLTKRLDKDNQLKNIYIDDNGNLKGNDTFIKYKELVNDFYKFELDRFIN